MRKRRGRMADLYLEVRVGNDKDNGSGVLRMSLQRYWRINPARNGTSILPRASHWIRMLTTIN